MTDRTTIQHAIDEAIQSEGSLFIRYRDSQGNITDRKISPLRWENSYKIRAFCHLRNEERQFLINNIVQISREPIEDSLPLEKQPPTSAVSQAESQVVSRLVPVTRPAAPVRVRPDIPAFSRVTGQEQFNQLLRYYSECLLFEYQQNFNLHKNELFTLPGFTGEQAYGFLSGTQNSEIRLSSPHDPLGKMLDTTRKRNNQLCLGKTFVCIRQDIISPLLFVPVTVEQRSPVNFLLKP